MSHRAVLLALLALSSAALAENTPVAPAANPAMPAGHPAMPAGTPSPGRAMPAGHAGIGGAADMSKSDVPLTRQGKVLTVVDAKQFTYFEILDGTTRLWVASPSIALKPGNTVKFADAPVQPKYHSPSLNRDFTNILFTVKAVVQ